MSSPRPGAGDAIDIWSNDFEQLCVEHGLVLRDCTPDDVEQSEAVAAHFVLRVFRQSRWLRWRFPAGLADEGTDKLARWFAQNGARKFKLSPLALKKIRGVFQRPPGARIYGIFLQDPQLQKLFPLALLPAGQRGFLGWLTTHGRVDQQLRDEEILWFLHSSSQQIGKGIAFSYLVHPEWQAASPRAFTAAGWRAFAEWLQHRYGPLGERRSLAALPPEFAGGSAPSATGRTGANILSHFCYPSGIQQAALWAKSALESAGVATSCRDVPSGVGTKRLPRAEWLGLEVHRFTITNVAPGTGFAQAYEQAGLFRREGVYRIAYWAWELENVPTEWRQLEPLLDEIWAPTEFVAQAMRSGMQAPVVKMAPGVAIGPIEPVARAEFGIPENHCVFLFMFDMYSDFERKNPLAVIRAFRSAFERSDPATLVIKTSRGTPDPGALERLRSFAADEGVILITEDFSRARAYGLTDMSDSFVSLHRSEGFGLGMAEAMLLGKPVIATAYSGNMSFMNHDNSLLVDYALVPVTGAGPLYTGGIHWAQPSEQQAAQHMRRVFEHREEATAVGLRAQSELREKLSLEAAGQRMLARLRAIEQEQGADVHRSQR